MEPNPPNVVQLDEFRKRKQQEQSSQTITLSSYEQLFCYQIAEWSRVQRRDVMFMFMKILESMARTLPETEIVRIMQELPVFLESQKHQEVEITRLIQTILEHR